MPLGASEDIFSQEEEAKFAAIYDKVLTGTGEGADFLGWRDLPMENSEELLEKIESVATLVQKKSEVLVVVGIGGSYLGAKAVIEALNTEFSLLKKTHYPKILFAGCNLSEDYLSDLLDVLRKKEYSLCVISKSGTTTEPAIAFRVLKEALEKKYGRKEARDRIIVITDSERGALRQMCRECGYESFVIRNDVGGRFSVLTPVGLLPASVAGVDIRQLLGGAKAERAKLLSQKGFDNPAWKYAAIRNHLYESGKKVEAFVTYEPRLQAFTAWCQQLFGESEGKDRRGLFPVSVLYSTDLHSLGQHIQEGDRMLFETVISVEKSRKPLAIPQYDKDLDQLNYLFGKTLGEVNHIAEQGVRNAHLEGGVWQNRVSIERTDAENLGALFYFFEFACAMSAYRLGVNPFDQPGVEVYKKNMFALLGKK